MPKKTKRPLFHYIIAVALAMLAIIEIVKFTDGRTPLQRKHNANLYSSAIDVNEHLLTSVVNGNVYRIGDLRGELSVLAFWAPWCGYCASEFPQIDSISRELAKADIKIVPIVHAKEAREDVESFYRKLNLRNIPPFVSGDGTLYQKLGVRGFPSFVVVDKNGMAIASVRPKWGKADVIDLFMGLRKGS